MNKNTACFTGHRHLPPSMLHTVSLLIADAIDKAYKNGYRRFLCGGALGFDTLAALQVLEYRRNHPDVELILVIPCGDQDIHWSEKDQVVYRSILKQADDRIVLSPAYYHGCMHTRNRYMVEHSSLCICYLYSFRGGTAYTVRYAAYMNIGIVNLAMNQSQSVSTMREEQCCSMYISLSAERNAGTVHLHPLKGRKIRQKNTLTSC